MSKQFSKISEKVPSDVLRETTATIAKQLNEPSVERLRWIVAYLGPDIALAVMEQTLAIEEQGGMLIQDGSRRRTPGGIFFSLVKKGVNKEDRRTLFPYTPSNQDKLWPKRRNQRHSSSSQSSNSRREYAIRTKYQQEIKALLKSEEFGVTDSMSVKLVGRPGKVIKKDSFIMTMMQLSRELPSISKDLPEMPHSSMRFLVYITSKQWNTVVDDLKQPENSLNINGILTYDENLRRMVVFARAVTLKIGQPDTSQQLDAVSKSENDVEDDTLDNVESGPVEFSEVEEATPEPSQTSVKSNEEASIEASTNEETAAETDGEASSNEETAADTASEASNDEETAADTASQASSDEETAADTAGEASSDEEIAADTDGEASSGEEAPADTASEASNDEETAADKADVPVDESQEEGTPNKELSLEEEFAEDEPQNVVESDLEWE